MAERFFILLDSSLGGGPSARHSFIHSPSQPAMLSFVGAINNEAVSSEETPQ